MNQMITDHKAIYKLFGSGICHKPCSILKLKTYEFHNINVGLFSGNDTRMAGYFIGMYRYLCMRKSIIATVYSAEFNTMSLNPKFSKVVSYIQDNKSGEKIYVLLRILFSFLWVILLAYSNKAGMEKLFYYAIITKINIIKSSSDIDNKELFPVSRSSYLKYVFHQIVKLEKKMI